MSYQIILSQEFKMRMAKAVPIKEQPKIPVAMSAISLHTLQFCIHNLHLSC